MKKAEVLKYYTVHKCGKTVFVSSRAFNFSYTKADDIIKDEFKGQYRYFGGLQCEYDEDSPDYKTLENWLCEIVEKLI